MSPGPEGHTRWWAPRALHFSRGAGRGLFGRLASPYTSTPVRLVRGVLAVLVLSLGSCHAPTAPEAGGQDGDRSRALTAGDRVRLVDHPDRPPLRLLHRTGDPAGAVAIAVYTDGGSVAALALEELFRLRLAATGATELHARSFARGVVVAEEADSPEEARSRLTRMIEALRKPIAAPEAKEVLARVRPLAHDLAKRAGSPSELGSCLLTLGSEGAREMPADGERDAAWLEQARAEAATAHRSALSALGDPELLEEAAAAHVGTWPEGEPIDDDWPSDPRIDVRQSGPPELEVALRVHDQTAALAAARALGSPDHPIHARLRGVDDRLRLAGTEVTLRPAGACIGVTVHEDARVRAPELESIASAVVALREELLLAVGSAHVGDETTLAFLAPENAAEAASLAAWAGISAASRATEPRTLVEYRAPAPAASSSKAAARLPQAVAAVERAWQERELLVSTRLEGGQAESWLLVGTPCGTSGEDEVDAGLLALTVESLALDFSGQSGVVLEPWVSVDGVGLVAHAPPLRGERPEQHAARMARAIGRALVGDALDGRDVAAARSGILARLGSDPGRSTLTSVLAGGSASWLSASGIERTVSPLSTADVERARAELAHGPLRAAAIASSKWSEGSAAATALSRWLAPSRHHVPPSCRVPQPKRAPAGVWSLTSIEPEVDPGVFVGVPVGGSRAAGEALAWLLRRPGGYLARALDAAEFSSSATAQFLGGERSGALVVEIRAESESTAPRETGSELAAGTKSSDQGGKAVEPPHVLAERQVRALLDALGRSGLPEADLDAAIAEAERRAEALARSPRGRLVAAWLAEGRGDAAAGTVDRAALAALAASLVAANHRVVRVERRR